MKKTARDSEPMTPFLKQVAFHYFAAVPIETRCFIFPNRRSIAFFQKYLAEAVASPELNASAPGHDGAARPVLLPEMLTEGDFFQRLYGHPVTDRILLVLELYDVYRTLNAHAEPLDDFVFWADVILGDFGDADKYLADPKGLFTNVSEFREIQDAMTWLTEDQRAAIESFVAHFSSSAAAPSLADDAEHPAVKKRFLQIWNLLCPLYTEFRRRLQEKGMAYEGMVYRDVAERLKAGSAADVVGKVFPKTEGFVFVGLNALNECEKTVMRKMRDAGLAEFCWDWCSSMIRDEQNRSYPFMKENTSDFPMTWDLEPLGKTPVINVVSVPSSVGQAKQLPSMISADGSETAVVLPDESLLLPVLNSIPLSVPAFNVTMGYPMKSSGIYALMSEAATLQLHLRERDGQVWFYHKQVWNIFSSNIFRKLSGPGGQERITAIQAEAKYYIPRSDLVPESAPGDSGLFRLLFSQAVSDPKSSDGAQIRSIIAWQKELLRYIGPRLAEDDDMEQEIPFVRRFLDCVRLLESASLQVKPQTWFRLLDQLLAAESVPYEGRPLMGMQIMGPLETRALDFRNVVILSCNEGIFPRHSVSSSFIPPELRKGFGLPTYEHQDSVWAYYFYRLIQRAETVWLLYDSRMEKTRTGEESRYVKQLRYHFHVPVNSYVAQSEIRRPQGEGEVVKPADFPERLKDTWLSATSLKNYLDCPVKFYYSKIEKLRPETEVAGSLDAGMVGNVYHAVMQALYLGEKAMEPTFPMDRESIEESVRNGELVPLKKVTADYVRSWLDRKSEIRARIRSLICAELNSLEVTGRNLVLEDVILQYAVKTLQRDLDVMQQKHTTHFDVLGLELQRTWTFDGYNFFGYIDRMDSYENGVVRIVDYKTGHVEEEDVHIDDGNAETVVEHLFGEDNRKRPKIALQMFLYDMYAEQMEETEGKRIVNVIYSPAKLFTEEERSVEMSPEFCRLVKEKLRELLKRMADPGEPLRRTEDRKTCELCEFKTICGR